MPGIRQLGELTSVESHFRFGENWAQFARGIDPTRIQQARRDLGRLLGQDQICGLTFLDVGCGSGIHSLAALRMGAVQVTAVDIDVDSVGTTKQLLENMAPNKRWTARLGSVLELQPENVGQFDIVYSWGVLHHTGAMHEAIRKAAALVSPGGRFCVALYRKTALCSFWRAEKRLYSRAPKFLQRTLRALYVGFFWTFQAIRSRVHGHSFSLHEHTRYYNQRRGMDFYTDVHDWLGGYPYEAITPDEIRSIMRNLGFEEERSFVNPGPHRGLFGSGCDEYVFERRKGSVLRTLPGGTPNYFRRYPAKYYSPCHTRSKRMLPRISRD